MCVAEGGTAVKYLDCRGDPSEMRQYCKSCGHADRFDFHVSDKMWRAVVPSALHTRAVCLSCFDAFAAAKGIDYRSALNPTMYFAGERIALELRAVPVRFFGQALVAKFARRRLRGLRRIVGRGPVAAVRTEVPRVVAAVALAVVGSCHLITSPRGWWKPAFTSIVSTIRSVFNSFNRATAVKGIVAKI